MKHLKILFASFATLLLISAMPDKRTTIFVIGDSTAANKDTTGGKKERGWAMMLQGCFDANYIVVDNHAINGRSSKSFINEGRWNKVLEKIKPGDYVIIQFGHNDEKAQPDRHTDPGSTFDANLEMYINETRLHGGIPVLMNCVVRRNFFVKAPEIADDELLRTSTFKDGVKMIEGDTLIDTHGLYKEVPKIVARRMNCHFIDANKITHDLEQGLGRENSKKLHMWFQPGTEPSEPKGKQDNTHYNIFGATTVANLLADALCKEIPTLKKFRLPKPKKKEATQQKRNKYEFERNLPVYAEQLIADLDFPMAWGNSKIKNFNKWKRAARQKVFDCMLTPPPAAPDGYNVKVLFEEQRNGYKARKIEIQLSKYYKVPAYVLIPDGKGPFPAINALHDHGAHLYIGKEKMIRPLACESDEVKADAEAWLEGYEGQFFGDYLAQHGYVVFSADAPMWGERGQKEGARRDRYDMIAGNMMMYGIDLSAYMTYDDIAGTEYLAQMPEVDANRIGCTGWSMGAYRSWMLSALSDRIKAGAAVCWMVTTDEQMGFKYSRTENGGFANCFPGLRRWLDYPHIASIACPKPMLFINGSQDKLFPVAGVEKAFSVMHDTWKSQGADDKLETELWDMPHSCPLKAQQRVLNFFDKYLK